MRNQISERVIDFVANVLKMVDELPPKTIAGKLSDKLIRSSTSVGANYEEAQAAESRKDFVHKLQVSLKEMRETYYWLCVLGKISSEPSRFSKAIDEAKQLRAILSKSVATAKGTAKPVGPLSGEKERSPITSSSPI
jgi:four helix bundle protein